MGAEAIRAALAYARHGWAILPLHGKLPAVPKREGGRGYLDATTDETTIRRWWERWPDANVGIATRASGLLPLDVDPRHGGDERLRDLIAIHGPLPNTPEVVTGSGGRHIYFRAPTPDSVQRAAGQLGEGLDLPNYVVAPPSIHPTTHIAYVWEASSQPRDVRLADVPAWLVAHAGAGNRPRLQAARSRVKEGPLWLAAVYDSLVAYLERGGFRPQSLPDGGTKARCPLHDDRDPSLTLHPVKGWRCFAGCGEGKITALAERLGVPVV